jgi:chemotaxis protein methyltransferase CheR
MALQNLSSSGGPGISHETYAFLQAEVYKDSGVVLDETKSYLMEARLSHILVEHRLRTLDQLCVLMKANTAGPLRQRVVEAMTTDETLFFRDAAAFDALQSSVLPEIVERRAGARRINIWSAAASTGQEAYSLAMMVLEMGLADWDLRVFATDLNRQVLHRAREGRYLQTEVNQGLPARYLVKYFQRSGLDWQISGKVRSLVEFAPFDLRGGMSSLGPFDLVLCRNVLVCFDVVTKRKILSEIRRTLSPGGLLLLGCAESTFNLTSEFTPVTHGTAVFYRAT